MTAPGQARRAVRHHNGTGKNHSGAENRAAFLYPDFQSPMFQVAAQIGTQIGARPALGGAISRAVVSAPPPGE